MNPYTMLSSGAGTQEVTALGVRLSAWHDAMVAHERRLRAGAASDTCDDECPHAEARSLWSEAVATLGARARALTFLRSRAQDSRSSRSTAGPADPLADAADANRRRAPEWHADASALSSVRPVSAVAEP
jgi:hypothetical protein